MRETTADDQTAIAKRYRRFAEVEARGQSPLYDELAQHVASSPALLRFLSQLPAARQQPNLFFAAVRLATRLPADEQDLEAIVRRDGERIIEIMRSRTTQTNEPNRCAVLLPVLAGLKGPLALIEVGASAGLCLLPDRYAYDYGRAGVQPRDAGDAPVFPCDASTQTPLPDRPVDIAWRAGLDLNPLDVNSSDAMNWLQTLVWPGQEPRAERLKAAIAVARKAPPPLHKGDLMHDLAPILSAVPPDTHRVVFHSAVLAYVGTSERDAFRRAMAESRVTWISNEAPSVFPDIAARATSCTRPGGFLLSVNAAPVAWTGPHGQWIEWIA